jgi:hypothetical protein
LFVLLIFGSIEIGRAVMVKHILEEVSRAGCRVAIMQDTTTADVMSIVDLALEKAGIEDYSVTISPTPPSSAEHLDPITVEITVPHSEVAWMSSPRFMEGTSLSGACIMPAIRDAGGDAGDVGTPPGKKNKSNKSNKK